ncbi:MAG: hypothetical protein II712_00125, partial [Erysipelotrichaceae bacterium]|nr:hypothetical protein [Erysipelotrichaceae bacterium]
IRRLVCEEIAVYFLTILIIPGIYVYITLLDASLSAVLLKQQALLLGLIFLIPVLLSSVMVMIYYTRNILQHKGE